MHDTLGQMDLNFPMHRSKVSPTTSRIQFAYPLVEEIHRTLTSATEALTRGFSLDNAWLSSKNEKSFRMSSNSELLLKGYTMFVYALGSRSAGNVKVERVFIYVITVRSFFYCYYSEIDYCARFIVQ